MIAWVVFIGDEAHGVLAACCWYVARELRNHISDVIPQLVYILE